MDTDNLRLFVLAAEKLNISAAGRALGYAPAVASDRLAKLEHELGTDLLHRSTRKVSLSTDGEDFLPYAHEILAQENAARAAMGLGDSEPGGTLRFAAPSTFAQLYIAPILPDFMAQYPGIDLDLRLSDTSFDLIDGSFDLALRSARLRDSSLKGRKLVEDQRILCASPGYLERHGVPDDAEDLSRHQLISFGDAHPKPLVGTAGGSGFFDPSQGRCRLIIDDGASQKLATMAGAGISSNSIWSVHAEISRGELVWVLPDLWVDDGAVLWLVYPQSNVLTAKVRALIDFLLQRIGNAPPWIA